MKPIYLLIELDFVCIENSYSRPTKIFLLTTDIVQAIAIFFHTINNLLPYVGEILSNQLRRQSC